jgi:hypothetical protein
MAMFGSDPTGNEIGFEQIGQDGIRFCRSSDENDMSGRAAHVQEVKPTSACSGSKSGQL